MSIEGAPPCHLCGAHSNYCHLETPVGISIDCRELRLREDIPADFYVEMARALREAGNDSYKRGRNDHSSRDDVCCG